MKRSYVDFFRARLGSLVADLPLPYDVYLVVNHEPVLFRSRGDSITNSRIRDLAAYKVREILIPLDQRSAYADSLKIASRNTDLKKEIQARFIKESAYIHVEDLFTKPDVGSYLGESKKLVSQMVEFISADMEAASSLMRLSTHDYYTYNHSVNVAVYSIAIAKIVFGEDKETLIGAGLGGLLHDIGKRRVDIEIINKPGKLNKEEWVEVKRHPEYGLELIQGLGSIPEATKLVVYEHHENMDGSGYPLGLNGDQISKAAKVGAIADVFDALTTKRPYKEAIGAKEALQVMYGMQPGKFDPLLFKYFDEGLEKKTPFTIEKDFDACHPASKLKKAG